MDTRDILETLGNIGVLLVTGVFIIFVIGLLYGAMGLCVAILWNFAVSFAFGLPQISWLHGTALLILFSILFGIGRK